MHTNVLRTVVAAGLLAVVSAGVAVAQQPAAQQPAPKPAAAKHQATTKHAATAKKETQKSLMAEAKIKEDSARKVALAQVPGGKVSKHELEREGGKLIYSYDIKVAGTPGVDEVHVDAITGAVISKQHESPAAEKKEAKAEAKAAAKKP